VAASAATMFHKWRLDGHTGAGYVPFYQLSVILPDQIQEAADDALLREADFVLFTERAISTEAGAALARDFTPRTSLTGTYSITRISFTSRSERQIWQQTGARLTHHLGKGLALRLGYGYRVSKLSEQAQQQPERMHDVDLGVDYSRALSFSRRTTLSFSTGSTIAATNSLVDKAAYRLFLTGTAQIAHEMGRTWNATAAFRRGIDFATGFRDPLLSNTVSAGIGGSLHRRVRLTSFGYYSAGAVGLESNAPTYDSASGNARVTIGLARRVTVFGEYFYDRYHVSNGVVLPFALANSFNRNGVRLRATATLTRGLAAFAEYLNYSYSFGAGAGVPQGLPPSIDRQGARVGINWVMPLLGSGREATNDPR